MSFTTTFGAFTTARLGIYAAQQGLNVTGNNIANINTPGYTRRRLDQQGLYLGSADRYQSRYSINAGSGVLCTGVSQIRDPYLDIRYRTASSSVGALDTKLSGLEDLSSILDEVAKNGGDGVIEKALSDIYKALQDLTTNTGQDEFDSLVRSAASDLVTLLNNYAKRLDEVEENTIDSFEKDIKAVNDILTQIRDLNASIRKSEIHGDNALDQRDQRNLLIDELSQYIKIDVTYEMEDLGGGVEVEKLVIKLGNANPDKNVTTDSATLIDGVYATQFQLPKESPALNPNYDPTDPTSGRYLDSNDNPTNDLDNAKMVENTNYDLTLDPLKNSKGEILTEKGVASATVVLDDNDLYGSLQSTRELLTENGEYAKSDYINTVDENAATKRGIPFYQNALDSLANKIATEFNKANSGYQVNEDGYYINSLGQLILDASGNPISKAESDNANLGSYPSLEDYLKAGGGVYLGGPLFSNSGDGNDTTDIRADNISISQDWAKGTIHIVTSFVKPSNMETGSTDNSNVVHLINVLTNKYDYLPGDVVDGADNTSMFHGSFQEMLTNISAILAKDVSSTTNMLNNYYTSATELDVSRDSVSGVDLNDEATSLMQYQKSYAAACRLMTTLDEAIDKLVNGTGIVGR